MIGDLDHVLLVVVDRVELYVPAIKTRRINIKKYDHENVPTSNLQCQCPEFCSGRSVASASRQAIFRRQLLAASWSGAQPPGQSGCSGTSGSW